MLSIRGRKCGWRLFSTVALLLSLFLVVLGAKLAAATSYAEEARLQAAALGTAFTYQGQLQSNGIAYTGACDLKFNLWDSLSGGAQIGATQTKSNVNLVEGHFTVQLDFGSGAFQGDERWLAIEVRCPAGSGGYTALSPRQPLTPTPYALALPGLWTQPNGTSPNLIGGYSGNTVTAGVVGATIGGGGVSDQENQVTDAYGTVGGGSLNQAGDKGGTVEDAKYATVGGGTFNSASGGSATVAGGNDNIASGGAATVGGGNVNLASGTTATVSGGFSNTASGDDAAVGGGFFNSASEVDSTVSGGSHNQAHGERATVGGGYGNGASGEFATVGGGDRNKATGDAATIGGGSQNEATALYATIAGGGPSDPNEVGTANFATDNYSTVGGGGQNLAGTDNDNAGDAVYATVAGGEHNTAGRHAAVGGGASNEATGIGATVSGGWLNTASGSWAAVPGGSGNEAAGDMSFAAGHWANADQEGCFVWGDSTESDTVTCSAANRAVFRSSGGFIIYSNAAMTTGVYLPAGSSAWQALEVPGSSSGDMQDNYEAAVATIAELRAQNGELQAQNAAQQALLDELAARVAALETLAGGK